MSVLFVIIMLFVVAFGSAAITYHITKEKTRESLYKPISSSSQGNAEMLAAQNPETLQIYLDNIKDQERNLTELEYLTFNYYKNIKMVTRQQKERLQKN